MKNLLMVFLVLAVCLAGPARADERTDVLVKITQGLSDNNAEFQIRPQEPDGDEAVTFIARPSPLHEDSFSCVFMIGRKKISFVSIWNGNYAGSSRTMEGFLSELNKYTKFGKFAINEENKLVAFSRWAQMDPGLDSEAFMFMAAHNVMEFYMFLDAIKEVSKGASPVFILEDIRQHFDSSPKMPERNNPSADEERPVG